MSYRVSLSFAMLCYYENINMLLLSMRKLFISLYILHVHCTCSCVLHVFLFAGNILINIHLFSPLKCSVLIMKIKPSTLHTVPVVKTILTIMAPQTHLFQF